MTQLPASTSLCPPPGVWPQDVGYRGLREGRSGLEMNRHQGCRTREPSLPLTNHPGGSEQSWGSALFNPSPA